MKSCEQNEVEKQNIQQNISNNNDINYYQQKELIDQEIYRQQQELQEILFQQNNSILTSISKFKTEYQELQNDVNIRNKVKKLEQLLAKTEDSNHQQEQNQKRKFSGSEKENSQLNLQQIEQLTLISTTIVIAKINITNQNKF
ncbi:regulator of chromosome condensation (RCC1) protein, putative (macronuclear) [Tetrahymena thermophila SB210]|uniref:Regulator of chromosome condensation (RCC1) protein, putative n=1 Tax=Tetrahymena thermophila (strain SB210) TaxID=312017 RepID=Q23E67_TETTS|nr:regulator of chromosome condensation (RCC1) protein, putative [Tetrahymena thermophila SB210]EAR94886.2 regulator of chromosome condensation (RCC1) protein, putative [Tetrahymena thermophila SB210]|eukprot:XP_001015131.2 regulator of chromosome condensation (RCC1) protein, putative [Tetrahymena thermophila SB210]